MTRVFDVALIEPVAQRAAPETPGESLDALADRALGALLDPSLLGGGDGCTTAAPPPRHVFVVAHTHLNKALVCAALGWPLSRHDEIAQANACVNVLDYSPPPKVDGGHGGGAGGWYELVALNLHDHIEPPSG